MSDEPRPLEPDRPTRERWLAQLSALVQDHLDALADAPAVGTVGQAGNRIGAESSRPVSEAPLPGGLPEALATLEKAVTASLTTPGPGYLAYVAGGGLYASALADFAADCFNRFTGLAAAAPAFARLEADVLGWLAREFGFGEAARGLLTSGGSLATFSAVVAAREDRLGDGADLRQAVAYTSSQAHLCVHRCLKLAGIPGLNLRAVGVDGRYRMDVGQLAERVAVDRAEGRHPFLVAATAGTTNSGAIDPLPEIVELCEREGLWLHVDAAYGGGFVLCDEGRRRLEGISRADSITFDPHKGLFLPYGTGCLLVREGEKLRRAHSDRAAYLQDFDAAGREGEAPSATEHGPELSRSFRGLRLWLPLMLHGVAAFREAVAEKLALAARIDEGLSELATGGATLEIVDPAQLSISTFRLRRRPGEALAAWNARNAALNAGINSRKRVFLSSTTLPVEDGEAFTLRTCVLCFRTHAEHVEAFLEDVAAALDELDRATGTAR